MGKSTGTAFTRATREILIVASVLIAGATSSLIAQTPGAPAQTATPAKVWPGQTEGDFVIKDFRFASGETLPELKIHYMTIGKLQPGADGVTSNAILILHGTGGTGRQFLRPQFAEVLFAPGGILDPARWFVILPDGIGHGGSSKPSDGLRARFPRYGYTDMVEAQHRLVTEHLGIRRLRLVMGTSMGCMHSWMWGERWPGGMDALMPLACLPVPIAGRNRLWRKMAMDAIREDPAWNGGEYTAQPRAGLKTAAELLIIAGSTPLQMQKDLPDREAADKFLSATLVERLASLDANDLLYQIDASRDYDPSQSLEKITAPVMYVNSADDFINPPELGIAEREIRRVPHGRFVLLPAGPEMHGHGSHTWAALWKDRLAELLEGSFPAPR